MRVSSTIQANRIVDLCFSFDIVFAHICRKQTALRNPCGLRFFDC